jgi:hypothetical protein
MDLYRLLDGLDFYTVDIDRARAQGMATARDFWERTEYPHLLLELVGALVEYGSLDVRAMVLCAVGASEQTLAYLPWGVMAPRNAFHATRRWALGEEVQWRKVSQSLAVLSKSVPGNPSTAAGFATAAAAQCARAALFAANPELLAVAVAEADLAAAYARKAIMRHHRTNEDFRHDLYSKQLRVVNLEQARAIRRSVSWSLIESGIAAFESKFLRED